MEGKILVAYASKYGATGEIAERIGEVLRQAGLPVDVLPVSNVHNLDTYRAVILGGALYVGKWPKEGAAFLRANEKDLSGRPVWLFSSGPTGEGDPVQLVDGVRLPADLQPIADRIHPRDTTVFHGFINPDRLNFIEKLAIKAIKKPMGEFRDWKMITAWAAGVAEALKQPEPVG